MTCLLDLARWLRPYWGTLVLLALALVVAAAAELAIGLAVRDLIDHGFSRDGSELVNRYFLGLFAVVAVFALASFFRLCLVAWLGERVAADIRKEVFSHVIGLSLAFFETTRTAEVLSRLTVDTSLLQTVIAAFAPIALRSVLVFFGGAILLAVTGGKLAVLVLVLVPLIVLPVVAFGRTVRRLSRTSQDEVANVNAAASESLRAVRTVHAFTHEELDRISFSHAVERAFLAARRRVLAESALSAIAIVLVFSLVNGVLWIGARDVVAQRMTTGELAAFVFYSVMMAGALGVLSGLWTQLQRAAGAAERLMELLRTEPEIRAPLAPAPLPTVAQGAVRYELVTFCYPSRADTPALDKFSLDIEPGETVALVGPSGAGKSTVFNLLLRFYDPQVGRIFVDGVDLTLADPRQVRSRISFVSQDPVIFSGTVAENIRYGRPEATNEEVHAAAKAAAADVFIEQLPEGFDTHLGERGIRLSGGQRQRLAIARSFLRDSRILLFDEATSSLDSENERLIQEALESLAADRTAIIIAHRLATVKKANRIVVMDRARIVGEGTHAQLMREDGLYAHLARLQFDGTIAVKNATPDIESAT